MIRFPFSSFLSLWAKRVAASVALVGISGCMITGDYALVATITGGEKIRVPLGHSGPVLAREGDLQVKQAAFTMNPANQFVYTFELSAPPTRGFQSVRVEDVSDEKSFLLVDETKPSLVNGRWRHLAAPLGPDAACLRWIFHVDNSLRVYRFTVVEDDGKTVVLYQGSTYSDTVKAVVRKLFGEKY